MLRVITVIVSSLLFALLGLAIGYLCVDTMRKQSEPSLLHEEFVLMCYMAPPAIGAVLGFIVSFVSLKWAGGPGVRNAGGQRSVNAPPPL
jgi:hypothetical protein